MSILRSVFTGIATVYNLSYTTSTATGQPIEVVVPSGQTIDISELKRKTYYDIQVAGNIKLEDYRFLSETSLNIQTQIIEVDGIRYRLLSKNRVGLNNKTFGYSYICSLK